MNQLSALTLLAILVLVASVACGGESEDAGDGSPTPPGDDATVGPQLLDQPESPQVVSGQVTSPVSGVIDIVASGNLFQQNNVAIPLGEAVVIRLTNSDLVLHNLRIAGLDGEYGTEDDAVTDPASLAGGDAGELTFAPPVVGEYAFRCEFRPATMGGIIVVE